jgi:UDP:flavonoid glycosyltransferase YjiC (YdhE family)
MAHDQFDNAERVKAMGVGARLDAKRVNAFRLAAALATLLADPGLPARCGEVAAAFDDGAQFDAACASLVAKPQGQV